MVENILLSVKTFANARTNNKKIMDPQEELDYEVSITLNIELCGLNFESKIKGDISINPNPKPTREDLENIAKEYFKDVYSELFEEYDCAIEINSIKRLN